MRVHTRAWYVQHDVKVAREKKKEKEKETEMQASNKSTTAFRFPGNFRSASGKTQTLSLSMAFITESSCHDDQKRYVLLCYVAFLISFLNIFVVI